jgi:hypothetical protein
MSGDRKIIEEGEARLLFRTWQDGIKVMTPERIKYLEKTYGAGAADRIKKIMAKMAKGEMT